MSLSDQQTTTALSRATIVSTAISLADDEGLAALSMRRIADALGCGTMSLYTYVNDKDTVYEQMLESVIAGVTLPPHQTDPSAGWQQAMRTTAASLRDMLFAHPWACTLWHNTWPGPARTEYMEGVLRGFRQSGFSPRRAHHGYHLFDLYVVGYVTTESSLDMGSDDPEEGMARFIAQTPVKRFPHIIEHVAQHAGDGTDDDFDFMLGLVLDGLDGHRD